MKSINDAIEQGRDASKEFLQRIRSELEKETASWLTYAPPEVFAQIARQIAAAGGSFDPSMRQDAPMLMAVMLGAPQTLNQLSTIAERMTPTMGGKQDESVGFAAIDACSRNPLCKLFERYQRTAGVCTTCLSQPLIWNNSPEFVAAIQVVGTSMYAKRGYFFEDCSSRTQRNDSDTRLE